MKTMMICFIALLAFGSAQAGVPSKKVSYNQDFTLKSSFGSLDKIYYNCDTVESAIEDQMAQMGATNIQVQCHGGLDDFMPAMPAYITLSYEALRASTGGDVTAADWKTVSIHSFNNCFLMTQVYEQVKGNLEMKDVKAPARCLRADSSFRMQMTTLF